VADDIKIKATFKGSSGTNWDKYLEAIKKNLILGSEETRDIVGDGMKAELIMPIETLEEMKKLGIELAKVDPHLVELFKNNPQTQKEMSIVINTLLKSLNTNIGLKDMGLQLDHADVNIIGLRLVGMYDVFVSILADMEGDVVGIPTGKADAKGNQAIFKRSRYWVQEVIKKIQNLIAMNSGMLEAFRSGGNMTPENYEKLRNDYLAKVDYDLTATKQKFRDAANNVDGELMSLQVIDAKDNADIKGGVESHTGQAATVFGGGMKDWVNMKSSKKATPAEQKILREIGKNSLDIIGSKTVGDELVKRTMGELTGKKYTPKKTKTKSNKSGRKRTKYAKKSREQLRLQKESAQAIKAMATAAALVSRMQSRKKEGGAGIAQRELNKLKRDINRRLPAEVRRQMGYPQLTNRTGIFSNSAEIISLRETAGGISGNYTYMRTGGGVSKNKDGVYETFESTGKRRWRGSYNPKPLIAKSIRELAEQYTKQKFTQLRRV
tara:strand:+ start:342 stop:1823 length:1482 start_codon:yes stop_codon:yes gene_type:complete